MTIRERYIATLFWTGTAAQVKIVYKSKTNKATFHTQTASPIWFPMYEDFDLSDPMILDCIDDVIGIGNRQTLFALLHAIRLEDLKLAEDEKRRRL